MSDPTTKFVATKGGHIFAVTSELKPVCTCNTSSAGCAVHDVTLNVKPMQYAMSAQLVKGDLPELLFVSQPCSDCANKDQVICNLKAENSRLDRGLQWVTAEKNGAQANAEREKSRADTLQLKVDRLEKELAKKRKASSTGR